MERLSKKKKFHKLSKSNSVIDWIENLLKTPIVDQRNYCLWAILVPYLLNIKHLSEEDTFAIVKEWLEKCDKLRKLSFDPKSKIYSAIKGNKGYKPLSFTKLKEEKRDFSLILDEILIRNETQTPRYRII